MTVYYFNDIGFFILLPLQLLFVSPALTHMLLYQGLPLFLNRLSDHGIIFKVPPYDSNLGSIDLN